MPTSCCERGVNRYSKMNRPRWPIWVLCAFVLVWLGTLAWVALKLVTHILRHFTIG